jgi:hypothetical protein
VTLSRPLAASAVALGLVVAAAPTWAAPAPEKLQTAAFAVPRDPSGQKAAATVHAVLTDKLHRHPRLAVVDPGRVLSGDPRTREEDNLVRARTALADGRRAYDALQLDDAIARLGQASSLYQQSGPLLGDLSELETALAYLGAALTLRGSSDEGVGTFLELLVASPGYTLTGFPPAVLRMFDRAVDRLAKTPKGALELYSTPPYAAAFVDGNFRGVTPLSLKNVAAGTHYVRLEANGYVTHGAPVEVTPNQSVTNQTKLVGVRSGAELRDILSRSSREVMADGMGLSTKQLARMMVTERLVLISVSQSGNDVSMTAALFDAETQQRIATERGVFDGEGPTFLRDVAGLVDRLLAPIDGAAKASGARGADASGIATGFGLGQGAATAAPPDVETRRGAPVDTGASKPPPAPPEAGGVERAPPPAPGPGMTATSLAPPPAAAPVLTTRRNEGVRAGTIVGWTMVGVGTVGVGVGIAFGVLAANTHADYRATPQASPDLVSIRDSGKTRALVADVSLFSGLALALGGVATLILTSGPGDTPEELLSATSPAPSLGVAPVPGGALVTLGGSL